MQGQRYAREWDQACNIIGEIQEHHSANRPAQSVMVLMHGRGGLFDEDLIFNVLDDMARDPVRARETFYDESRLFEGPARAPERSVGIVYGEFPRETQVGSGRLQDAV